MKKLIAVACAGAVVFATTAAAQDTIKIALVHGISGSSYEVFSRQTHTGFMMGL